MSIGLFQQRVTRRLLWWSGFSIVTGLLMRWRGANLGKSSGAQTVAWGLGDALSAMIGQHTARQCQEPTTDADARRAIAMRERRNLKRLLWINIGLALARMKGRMCGDAVTAGALCCKGCFY